MKLKKFNDYGLKVRITGLEHTSMYYELRPVSLSTLPIEHSHAPVKT